MIKIVTFVQEVVATLLPLVWFPLNGMSQAWSLVLCSVIFGVVMVFCYGLVSNQSSIRRIKNQISCHILETYLFRYDTVLSLRAQGRLFATGVRYFVSALAPMVILAVPCILILSHLNLRFGYRPLQVGEERLVRLTFADSVDLKQITFTSDTLRVTGPVRNPKDHSAYYKIKADAPGVHTVSFSPGFKSEVFAGEKNAEVSVPLGIFLTTKDWVGALFYPNGGKNQSLTSSELVEASLSYPEKMYAFFGVETSWVLPFLVVSLLSGYIFSKFVGVAV